MSSSPFRFSLRSVRPLLLAVILAARCLRLRTSRAIFRSYAVDMIRRRPTMVETVLEVNYILPFKIWPLKQFFLIKAQLTGGNLLMLNRILIPLQNIDSYCAFINSNLNISLYGDIPFRYSNYRHYTIHSLGVTVYITKKTIVQSQKHSL